MINALVLSGNTLYVGGDFTTNDGLPPLRLAALDATNGNAVAALALSGNTLYAGGAVTNIDGQVHVRIAAGDAATGAPTT